MLQKDFQTNENQYYTTYNACRFLVFRSEDITDFYAQYGEKEGGEADDKYRGPNLYLDASKRNTHRQSIDAGGDSEEEHRFEIEGTVVLPFFLVATNGFANHIGTN